MEIKLKTTENERDQRIDSFLAEKIPECSRSQIQKLIKEGDLEVDGKVCTSPKTGIKPDSKISITIPEKEETPLPKAKEIPLDIIYEDDHILVINKPYDMVVHPGDGNENDTIVNALLWKYANFAEPFQDKSRPGIVHRLDKDTTGCLLIAKREEILEKLIQSFKEHKVEKTYIALVSGHFKEKRGTIQSSIGRHPGNRKKMAVLSEGGKEAISHFEVIKDGSIADHPVSLLKVNIETGRTHQIRVHLSSIQKPVIGDSTYGGKLKNETDRQMLHAWKLAIPHPATGKKIEFECPIPADMQRIIDSL